METFEMCLKVVWLPFQSIHVHKIFLLSYRSTLHQWTFKEACQWLNCSIILAIYWKPHSRYWPNVHLTPPPWKNVLVYSPLIDPCLRKSCLRPWLDDEPRTIVLFLSIKSYWHTGWLKKRFGRKDATQLLVEARKERMVFLGSFQNQPNTCYLQFLSLEAARENSEYRHT